MKISCMMMLLDMTCTFAEGPVRCCPCLPGKCWGPANKLEGIRGGAWCWRGGLCLSFNLVAADNPDNMSSECCSRPPGSSERQVQVRPVTLICEATQVSPETISATVEEEVVKVQDKLVAERSAPAFIDLSSPQQVSQQLVTSGLVQSLLRCLLLQVSLQCQSSAPEDQGSLEIRGRGSHQAGA